MRNISDAVARLAAAAARTNTFGGPMPGSHLRRLDDFGSNPGALLGHVHIPNDLAPNAPLVVVLHGCTQTATGYDLASGWSQIADELGFALLYPEQRRANNANGCFNWFEPGDTQRDAGEALSIRQMIAAVLDRHAIDSSRVFVTGLSAGGAMAAALLAVYPEVFAGGAVIAGLPHGVASGMVQAFERMRGHGLPSEPKLRSALRDASDHRGPWPCLSVWHGDADQTVSVSNCEAILAQWRGVHGLTDPSSSDGRIDGAVHRSWQGTDGRVVLEAYVIPGMGHGTPLKTTGSGAYGRPAPYMLDVGLSSTARIAQFWGIGDAVGIRADEPRQEIPKRADALARIQPRRIHGQRIEPPPRVSTGVGQVIEDALRAAGLMK